MYNIKYLRSWICILNNLKLIVIFKCKLKYVHTLTLFRAEILYRCQIPPFAQSRSVLEPLLNNVKTEEPDILELCHIVPKEVLSLDGGKGVSEITFFNKWTHTQKNCRPQDPTTYNEITNPIFYKIFDQLKQVCLLDLIR